MPDSTTGGFLRPINPQESAEDLEDIIHDLIAGVTCLPGNMVRPKWQGDATDQPGPGMDWCAFGITEECDGMAGETHHDDGANGYSVGAVHEPFAVAISFYGRNSRRNASNLRIGLGMAQNRECLYRHHIALVDIGPVVHVPEIVGQLWNDRRDVRLTFRRRVANRYDVKHLLKPNITVRSASGLEVKSH